MSDGGTVRTFVSLEIPEDIIGAVVLLQGRLKASGADVRWTPAAGFHLTLKFLGRVEESRIPEIAEVLNSVAAGEGRFRITVSGVGAFPTLRNPRVLWAGIGQDRRLNPFQKNVDQALAGLGFAPDERSFQPHLTLGRIRSPRGRRELTSALEAEAGWSAGECELTALYLMRSDLRPEGAAYSILWSQPFSQSSS